MSVGKFLQRYSPLIILAVVQLVVIMLAPSTNSPSSLAAGSAGPTSGTVLGSAPAGGGTGNSIGGSGTRAAGGGSLGAGSSGTSGTTTGGTAAGGATIGGATRTAGGAVVGSTTSKSQITSCGRVQPAPWSYMPPCLKFKGLNGGASMPGVTGKTVNILWYDGNSTPAALGALGAKSGLTYSSDQLCYAIKGYTKDLNNYWQTYGRTFVDLNGPGSHSGMSQGKKCHVGYFLGSGCGQTDAACWRADADAILAMKDKPAVVLGNVTATLPFYDELAKHHMLVLGQGQADSFTQPRGPYVWDWQMSAEQTARIGARYFCQKLTGKPVRWAGSAVMRSGSNPTTPPTRKIAVVYDVAQPDVYSAGARYFASTVEHCGGGTVGLFPFNNDLSQVPQEMQTIAAKLKIGGYTTVYLYMDLISAVPLSNDLNSENWLPELVIDGAGAIDDDRLAQLMNQNAWRYAFGVSNTDFSAPISDYDFYKAYKASHEPGQAFALADNVWPYFWMAGDMFQLAGPAPTIGAIQTGMFHLAPMGGTEINATEKFGVPGDSYLGQRDVREVWWCPTQKSPENGSRGTYVPVDGGRRFTVDQIDRSTRVYPHGVCPA